MRRSSWQLLVAAIGCCPLSSAAVDTPIRSSSVVLNDGHQMPVVSLGTCCQQAGTLGVRPWLEAGGLGIDTAIGYGSEPGIAAALRSMQPAPNRSALFLTTKIHAGSGSLADCQADPELAIRSVHQSLKNLKHSPQLCLNMQNSYTSEAQKRENHKALYKQYVEKLGREEYNRRCKAYQRQPERVAYKQQWEARHKDRRKEYFRAMYHYQCSWGGDRQYHNNLLRIDPAVFN